MNADVMCAQCFLYHPPPPCKHDFTVPCSTCGAPIGPRFTADDGTPAGDGVTCWRCHWWKETP